MAEKTNAERVAALNWLTLIPLAIQVFQMLFGMFGKLPASVQGAAIKAAVGFDWKSIDWQKWLGIILKILEMFGKQPAPNGGNDWPKI